MICFPLIIAFVITLLVLAWLYVRVFYSRVENTCMAASLYQEGMLGLIKLAKSVISLFVIEVPIPSHESESSFICVSILPLSTIAFSFGFGNCSGSMLFLYFSV